MFKLLSRLAISGGLVLLPCLGAAPAKATSFVTFVSGKGADAGTCAAPSTPCRTFQFALSQTNANGEIKALDPAFYGAMIINKPVSITGVEGASVGRASFADAITINAGANDTISLSHLTIDGFKTAKNGILVNSAGSLTVTHCTIRNFKGNGLLASFGARVTAFAIAETLVSNNLVGIGVGFLASAARGIIDHVLMSKNGSGLILTGGTLNVTSLDSVAANNSDTGFFVSTGPVLRLAHSSSTGNRTGVFVTAGTVESFGDNYIRGNDKDVDGALTKVSTQ